MFGPSCDKKMLQKVIISIYFCSRVTVKIHMGKLTGEAPRLTKLILFTAWHFLLVLVKYVEYQNSSFKQA